MRLWNTVLAWFSRRTAAPVPGFSALVVGIGNVGDQYAHTRHNIGFDLIDAVVAGSSTHDTVSACQAKIWYVDGAQGQKIVLAQPTTFVNRSGLAVAQLLERYRVQPARCLVVVDDYHLPIGRIRMRRDGSDGGHNGLKSIISHIGQGFPRLRVGIGPLPAQETVIDFVLGRFSPGEEAAIKAMMPRAVEAIRCFCETGIEKCMNTFNAG